MKSLFHHPAMHWLSSDGRHFQIISQVLFLAYGIIALDWGAQWFNYLAAASGTLLVQSLAIQHNHAPLHSLKSALITTLGLSLLLKANSPVLFLCAALLAIGQKFLLRINGKHLWNPANFGIVAVIVLSGQAWISPGQWGSSALIVFIVGTAGLAVLSKVRRLDTGLVFLGTFMLLDFSRTVLYLGWGPEVWLHKLGSGSLWLFSLFMITDPMTTPNHRVARFVWSALVGAVSFYVAAFHFVQAAPFWVLFFATPLVPLFDWAFKAQSFQWLSASHLHTPLKFNHMLNKLKSHAVRLLLIGTLSTITVSAAHAFCGFYVAKADATLFNNKSEIILVRDGLKTVITMSNDFKGDLKEFALVVPVPVVLKESDIKVVNRRVFDGLDAYSAPRLVEYYDNNPCVRWNFDVCSNMMAPMAGESETVSKSSVKKESMGVTIEAQYTIGEYDILLLSAKESTGLKDWLISNGYKIPETAETVLQPYVKSNMKFFVVKVNLANQKNSGFNYLRPIQIKFEHEKFMLPIRLGMANSQGNQDMIVYAFTKTGRVECTNYRTVKMPTDRNVPLFVKSRFGQFYKDLFQRTWRNENSNAVFLEYAWNVSPYYAVKCDPCVGPPPVNQDFVDAGIDWIQPNGNSSVFFTRMHVRYSQSRFPSDLWFQVTPNTENYQCRYILTNPATGDLSCDEGQEYIADLLRRRKLEVDELNVLAGWYGEENQRYINEYKSQLKKESTSSTKKKESFWPVNRPGSAHPPLGLLLVFIGIIGYAAHIWLKKVREHVAMTH